MPDWRYVVPSRGRSGSINADTIATLLDSGADPERITVYAAEDGVDAYRAAIPHSRITVSPAPLGMSAVNDHIGRTHHGEWVVRCDDDLRELVELSRDGTKLVPLTDLDARLDRMIGDCHRRGLTLWGVSPVANPFYMSHTVKAGLYYAYGPFNGYIANRNDRCLAPPKEDYERTLQHYERAGAVARYNALAFKNRPMRSYPGGIQADIFDRRSSDKASVRSLIERWPHLVHRRPDRDGFPEVALRLPKKADRG